MVVRVAKLLQITLSHYFQVQSNILCTLKVQNLCFARKIYLEDFLGNFFATSIVCYKKFHETFPNGPTHELDKRGKFQRFYSKIEDFSLMAKFLASPIFYA